MCRRAAAVDKRFRLLALDELIQYEARGATVEDIVGERGWAGFRDLEFEVAQKAGSMPGWALVDCGGGGVALTRPPMPPPPLLSARHLLPLRPLSSPIPPPAPASFCASA